MPSTGSPGLLRCRNSNLSCAATGCAIFEEHRQHVSKIRALVFPRRHARLVSGFLRTGGKIFKQTPLRGSGGKDAPVGVCFTALYDAPWWYLFWGRQREVRWGSVCVFSRFVSYIRLRDFFFSLLFGGGLIVSNVSIHFGWLSALRSRSRLRSRSTFSSF